MNKVLMLLGLTIFVSVVQTLVVVDSLPGDFVVLSCLISFLIGRLAYDVVKELESEVS